MLLKDCIVYAGDKLNTFDEFSGSGSDMTVLKFAINSSNNISSRYKGKMVYPDWNHVDVIQPGDIWICSMEMNPKDGGNYFAVPMMRIDASFLYGLNKSQLSELSLDIWNRNREILEPVMEEIFGSTVEEMIESAVSERTKDLEEENSKLKERLESAIESPRSDKIDDGSEKVTAVMSTPKTIVIKDDVVRIDDNTLESGLLVHPKYRVHMTANHDVIVFRPDINGRVTCMNNRVSLNGLGTLIPFTGECEFGYNTIGDKGEFKVFLV